MTTEGHSRSRILGSVERRQGTKTQPVKTVELLLSTTPLSFDAPSPGNPANIHINFILPETRVFVCHFATYSAGLSSFEFLWWAPKPHVFWNIVRNSRSRSYEVVEFSTNRKRVCNFPLVINSNFCPILPRLRDIASFLLKTATPHLFRPNFVSVPFGSRL